MDNRNVESSELLLKGNDESSLRISVSEIMRFEPRLAKKKTLIGVFTILYSLLYVLHKLQFP